MLNTARVWRAAEANPIKRYLMEYHTLVCRRDALLQELEHLRAAAQRTSGRITAEIRSAAPNPGSREDAMLRVVDAQTRLQTLVDHICEALLVRLALIDRLSDERHKTLLTLRYINALPWETIGYQMHYERTQLFEIHTAALREAQTLLEG